MDVTALLIPLLLAAVAAWGVRRKVDVYTALTDGAAEGLRVVLRICPNLIALLSAVYMLRASGALDFFTSLLAPVLTAIGIPPETAPLLLIRADGRLRRGQHRRPHGGGDAGLHRDHLLHHRCLLRRGRRAEDPLHRPRRPDGGLRWLSGGGMVRAAFLLKCKLFPNFFPLSRF